MLRTRLLTLLVPLAVLLVHGQGAHADPEAPEFKPLTLREGAVVLPLSGLALSLPPAPGEAGSWQISGSWALSDDGRGFDGRDVLDRREGERLVAGTWLMLGHFDAGDCKEVLKGSALADAWHASTSLHGAELAVAGGIFSFTGSLGDRPALALCAPRKGRKSLLMYHFFLDRGGPPVEAKALAELAHLAPVDAIVKAWIADATQAQLPLTLPYVRNRGKVEAARPWAMPKGGLEVAIPADGQLWLARSGDEGEVVDWFERLVPALPEVEVEVAWLEDLACRDLDIVLPPDRARSGKLTALPEGWVTGPTLMVQGRPESTTCLEHPSGALLAGVFMTPTPPGAEIDSAFARELLKALGQAMASRPDSSRPAGSSFTPPGP